VSRYGVDKALRRLIHDAGARDALQDHPDAALEGCELDEAERRALLAWDVGTLYQLGAHPFLLWNAFSGIAADREAARKDYLAAIRPHGYPDYTT
jgi:hypothetical protein